MATPIQPANIPSPEVAFENPGGSPEGTPAQFDMGQNPDGTFQRVGESVGSWRPNADPSVVNFEDLQHAAARIVRGPERDPDGDGLEALSGTELLSELRGAINDFNGVGSERETMSRLSRFNPFRHENKRHSAEDVKRSAERLDAVQEEMSTRLEEVLRSKERNGNPYFDDDAVETALAAHKLFGTFTVARLRKESLESQADKSTSRGILGKVSAFLTRKVVDIDHRVENEDISKNSGRLRKFGYFGITALPLGVAGIAAAPLLGLGAGAAAIGAGAFAAARVGRGLFSAKIQNTADSITRAERDQIARVNQQMGEDGSGITSAFVEGGEAKVRQADKRLLLAAGSTAAFGALGYFAGNFIGNIGRDLKDNGILHYMGDGVDKTTDFGDDFIGGDGNDSGSTSGESGDSGSADGDGKGKDAPSDPGDSEDSNENTSIIDTVTGAANDTADAASSAYQDIKEKGLLNYLTEGLDTAHDFGDDVLNGTGSDQAPQGPGTGQGEDTIPNGGAGVEQDAGANAHNDANSRQQMTEAQHKKDGFIIDAETGETISIRSLNVKPGGGFISTFQEQYGLSGQQANDLYYRIEPHLRGMDGTYSGPGDVRISAPGELQLSQDAQNALHDELVKMGVAEDKKISIGISDAKAVSEPRIDPARAVDTPTKEAIGVDSANTGGLQAEDQVIISEDEVRSQIDDYLDPNRLQDESSWGYVDNIISGADNGAISAEQMAAINDQVTTRVSTLEGLRDQLEVLLARGHSAELAGYEDRLNLAIERLHNVNTILEEAVKRSTELNSGE